MRLPLDLIAVLLAGYVAYDLRTSGIIQNRLPLFYQFDFVEYRTLVLIYAILVLIVASFSGLYRMKITRGVVAEFTKVFNAVSTATLIVILYYFFASRDIFSSRFVIISLWLISIIFIIGGRIFVRVIQTLSLQYLGIGLRRVAIIGNGRVSEGLQHTFNINPGLGYKVILTQKKFNEKQLVDLIKIRQLDDLILADSTLDQDQQMYINDFCDEHKIEFQYHPQLFDTYDKVDIRTFAGTILFRVKRTTLEGWGSIQKRIFDIIFASVFILIFSPLYILVAIAIKVESKGPVFYKSMRVGAKNTTFPVYKYRSMYTELCTDESNPESIALEQKLLAEKGIKTGPVNKIKDDPRVTKVGAFLRKTSIDEFPQFFNVLRGEMSVSGPRPHQPREVAKYEKHHKKVLTLKPGITGMAQVNGRSDLTFEEEVLYDTFYIENWSLLLDLIIIAKTPWAVLAPRKAD